jgi:hypothetical protein
MFIPDEFADLKGQYARFGRALEQFSAADGARLQAALKMAEQSHGDQRRRGPSKIPYIIHPIRVACSLVDEYDIRDADMVIAGLLHDVAEDSNTTIEEIRLQFGGKIAELVEELTWEDGIDKKWEQARAMLGASAKVRMVKMSDVIDNSRAMWHLEDRGEVLRLLYGYGHWGRTIVESIGEPAVRRLNVALVRSTAVQFSEDPDPDLRPNPGKSLHSDAVSADRYPIHTHVVTEQDSVHDVVLAYATPYLRPGDVLAISERMVAVTQGRGIPISEIHPRWMARQLVRFVTKNPAGIGLASPWTMELAIREAGVLRILAASLAAAVTKPFGFRGIFYRVAGNHVNAIDGPCDYTLPPYNRYATLGPEQPERVAESIARHTGVSVAIIDANDLGVEVLGASEGVDREWVKMAFADNPLGQSCEQTPMAIVRRGAGIVTTQQSDGKHD